MMVIPRERLSEDIRKVVGRRDLFHHYITSFKQFSNVMMVDIDVFDFSMIPCVFCECDSSLVVAFN